MAVLCSFQWEEYPVYGLRLQIMQAQTSGNQDEKKHVIYKIIARIISSKDDLKPVIFDRRYTQFSDLYYTLKKEHPHLMTFKYDFPSKKLFGNFSYDLVCERGVAFEEMMNHIIMETNLRNSKAMLEFLQDTELKKAKDCLSTANYSAAMPLLEQNFLLLNKIFTNRHPPVILALSRLFACCMEIPDMPNAFKYGSLAVNRFEWVCDTYLLELYIPLIHACIKVWNQFDKDDTYLKDQLLSLKRQGINVNQNLDLVAAIDVVEKKL
ncbi:unnamed protein product [Brassicogethes aeneus]|uniref:PX domain-containing protein n=1 Tax=Brassicogethes aeneus TaxID=1431903 RepID=A0A9P0FJM6_BRAAE|nr:unnamed protein product [Brassicogethes aeneus]